MEVAVDIGPYPKLAATVPVFPLREILVTFVFLPTRFFLTFPLNARISNHGALRLGDRTMLSFHLSRALLFDK